MKKQTPPANRKMKILIIDDFEVPRRLIRNMLHELGYESHENIMEATNGLDALHLLENTPVDLIICDWVMPTMTGFDLLKKVRATPALARIPFIMVTAEAEKENILGAIKAGVSQYIVKPFTAEILYQKIDAAMRM
ncbi:response regulator [Thiovibrio sp. JS02]